MISYKISYYIDDMIQSVVDTVNEFRSYRWMIYGFRCIADDIINYKFLSGGHLNDRYSYLYNDIFYNVIYRMNKMIGEPADDVRLLKIISYRVRNDPMRYSLLGKTIQSVLRENGMNDDFNIFSIIGDNIVNRKSERIKVIYTTITSFDIMMNIYSEWNTLPRTAVFILRDIFNFAIEQIELTDEGYDDDNSEPIIRDFHMEDLHDTVYKQLKEIYTKSCNLSYFKRKLIFKYIDRWGIDPTLSLSSDISQMGYFEFRHHCKGLIKKTKPEKIYKM